MKLSEKQRLFTQLIGELIVWAYNNDMELTFGDCYRSPSVHYGHPKSTHRSRLAVDFNLFVDDEYKTKTEDYKILGEKWESMHSLCKWGGRFEDGNHFSFEHEGVK